MKDKRMHGVVAVETGTGGPDFRLHALLSIGVYTVLPHGQAWGWGVLMQRDPRKEVDPAGARAAGYQNDTQWRAAGAMPPLAALTSLLVKMEWLSRQFGRTPLVMVAHNTGFSRSQFLHQAYAELAFTLDDLFWFNWECSLAVLSFCRRAGLLEPGACSLDALNTLRAGGPVDRKGRDASTNACDCYLGYQWLVTKCGRREEEAEEEEEVIPNLLQAT